MARSKGTGSIENRGTNRWLVSVELGRGVSGERRRFRQLVRGTRRDAERTLREAISEREHDVDLVGADLTVTEWLERWIEQHRIRRGIAPTTVLRYERVLRLQLKPTLGHILLRNLRTGHIEALYATPQFSEHTRRRCHVVLNRVLDDAVRARLISRNPLAAIEPPHAPRSPERRSLTPDDIVKLLTVAADSPLATPIRLALSTGLRQGELLALTWGDVDPEARTISIQRGMRSLPGLGPVFAEAKTRNARRAIELSDSTIEILRKHRQHQLEARLQMGAAWHEQNLVLPSAVGTPWIQRNFYRAYRGLVLRSGIADPNSVTWHTLRHSAATLWIRAGADVHTVSRRLGHASAAFTMDVYAHLLAGQQKVAAEALDYLIAGQN